MINRMDSSATTVSVISTNAQSPTNGYGKPTVNGKKEGQNELHAIEFQNRRKPSQVSESAYEPYDNRMVKKPTSTLDTLFHLLKGSLGTGILAMPLAFQHSGYGVGVIATILIGIFCTYSIHLLVSSSYELCRRRKVPALSYQETAKAAFLEGPEPFRRFASISAHVANGFLILYQLGTCTVYTVFISGNLHKVVSFDSDAEKSQRYWMLIIIIPLILINWIRNLKYLAPVSKLANLITFISFGIIVYYMSKEEVNEERKFYGSIGDFPKYFGTVLFALEAIGVILPLENEMKNPKAFKSSFGVLNIGMFLITGLYILMGFYGYWAYGEDTKGSININLPQNDLLSKCVQIMLALSIYMTHPLQCYVAIEIIWDVYIKKRISDEKKIYVEYVIRTFIVIITWLIGAAVPKIDLFMLLIGALTLSVLALAFPAIIETCTYWSVQSPTKNKLMLAKNTLIVLFALVGLFSGTYVGILEIITYLQEEKKTL